MFNSMFKQVNLIQKGLDTAYLRQEVISHNLANVDTPGYKSQHVEFETMFRAALENNSSFSADTTHPQHFKIGFSDPLDVQATVVSETFYDIRMDENNVDADQEMTELAENTITYNLLVDQLNNEFSRLRMVIREGS